MKRRPTYSTLAVMLASTTEPLPARWRTHQLQQMYQGLHALETSGHPAPNDWRCVSDAVNLLETLVAMGVVQDAQGLLPDAIAALAKAARRRTSGHALRLDGPGIQAVRAVLEDYAAVLNALPARTIIQAHRATEQRIWHILDTKQLPQGVQVVNL
jgi:hypothetical protein